MLKIAMIGCGHAARVHSRRLAAIEGVRVVGVADHDRAAAEALALAVAASAPGSETPLVRDDHQALLRDAAPDAVGVFTPHLHHYRVAIDALQAGCHVFVEKPLSTNVQEAADLVRMARGRERVLAVGHQYRLRPSLRRARRLVAEGRLGNPRLVTATLAQPWLESHQGRENSWRFDPRVAGAGILADAGDHLIDALLWILGKPAREVAAVRAQLAPELDLVTAAAIRLADDLPATLAVSGVSAASLFQIDVLGENAAIRVTEHAIQFLGDSSPEPQPADSETSNEPATAEDLDPEVGTDIDRDFVRAVRTGAEPCCPGREALDTVRLLEAIVRSSTTGRLVGVA